MRGGVLPPALLFAALALMLPFASRRAMLPALGVAAVAAIAVANLPIPKPWTETMFIGCWISVIVTAALVHLRRGPDRLVAVPLALNAGAWAGGTVAVAGAGADLARALPVLLLALPGQWLVAHGRGIAVKVIASWLIAIAVLAATLATIPTPGYVQDHME